MLTKSALIFIAACAMSTWADARIERSAAARHAFVKTNACPSTGRHRLPCPGYQIDHVIPLCAGGIDKTSNLQWLEIQAHKGKTRLDIHLCKIMKFQQLHDPSVSN